MCGIAGEGLGAVRGDEARWTHTHAVSLHFDLAIFLSAGSQQRRSSRTKAKRCDSANNNTFSGEGIFKSYALVPNLPRLSAGSGKSFAAYPGELRECLVFTASYGDGQQLIFYSNSCKLGSHAQSSTLGSYRTDFIRQLHYSSVAIDVQVKLEYFRCTPYFCCFCGGCDDEVWKAAPVSASLNLSVAPLTATVKTCITVRL